MSGCNPFRHDSDTDVSRLRAAARRMAIACSLPFMAMGAGCEDVASIGPVFSPRPRIHAERIGPGIMPPTHLSGWLGRAHESITELILASWWGLSKQAHDAGIVCHERTLDEAQAELLAGNRLLVILPELRELRPEVARVLATCTGCLRFGALESIDPAAAAALACPRDLLSLTSLHTLDAAAADGLAANSGPLLLDGIWRLEPGVAKGLAGHRGPLSLNGLVALSPEDAAWLARHDGDLYLNGLSTMPVDVARAFADFPHGLFINGVETLSTDAACALARHPGWCLGCTGLVTLDEKAVAALSTHPRSGWSIRLAEGLMTTPSD